MLLGAYVGFLGAYYGALGLARLPRRNRLPEAFASVFMIVLCVWLGLDQIVVGIAITLAGEGITSVLQQSASSARRYPPLERRRRSRSRSSTASRSSATSLFDQPPSSSTSASRSSASLGLDLPLDEHRPQPPGGRREARGARRRRRQRRRYAQLRRARDGRARRASAAPTSRSSVAGVFTPFITQGQGFMAIVIAMLAPWPAARRACSARSSSGSLSRSRRLAADRRYQHLHGRHPHAPVRAIILALMLFARRAYLPPALALPYVRGAR